MKPLYVVGTQRNVGKTTFCIGLISALRERGLRVGYTKPLGQRVTTIAGHPIHDDALVVSQVMNLDSGSESMAVPLTQGRVEKEIYDLRAGKLEEKVLAVCRGLRKDHDAVIIEGMGHVAMGSCLKLSAADVAKLTGARALLICGGGIGRTIDEVFLCSTFLTARGASLIGAIVNKVWPEKYHRVLEATTKGLANLGIRTYGTVPFEETLSRPTIEQIAHRLEAEILTGQDKLDGRAGKTIVAAMEADHMVSYLSDRALVITPGDRTDNILAILTTHTLAHTSLPPVAGIVLTGGFRPRGKIMSLLAESGLPALLCREDTYTVATKLRETVFKITPTDKVRIGAAMCMVDEYVDVDGILDKLQE